MIAVLLRPLKPLFDRATRARSLSKGRPHKRGSFRCSFLCSFLFIGIGILAAVMGGSFNDAQAADAVDTAAFFHEMVKLEQRSIGNQERDAAMREALAAVLVRLSGKREVLRSEAVQQALDNGRAYLLRYSTATSKEHFTNTQGQRVPVTELLFDFDPNRVINLLKSAGEPIWELHRPVVVVWWTVDEAGGRFLLNEAEHGDLAAAIARAGQRYGVQFRIPLMDASDRYLVNSATVSGYMVEELQNASIRYGADHMVVGGSQLDRHGSWRANWQWVSPQHARVVRSDGMTPVEMFDEIGERVAAEMSTAYAVVIEEGAGDTFWLEVSDIGSFAEYKTVHDYLSGLPNLNAMKLVGINQSQLCYRMALKTSMDQFRRIIRQNRKLVEAIGMGQRGWREAMAEERSASQAAPDDQAANRDETQEWDAEASRGSTLVEQPLVQCGGQALLAELPPPESQNPTPAKSASALDPLAATIDLNAALELEAGETMVANGQSPSSLSVTDSVQAEKAKIDAFNTVLKYRWVGYN